jgi:hypothetical protein
MKRLALSVALLAAAFCAALVAPPFRQGATTAYAQTCTIKGKQISTPEGTLVCDCTQDKDTNCGCMIECKRPPLEE